MHILQLACQENQQKVAQLTAVHLHQWHIYYASFAAFPLFFLPLPGTGMVILRGRAFPPLTLKSTVAICKLHHHMPQCRENVATFHTYSH